MVHCFVRIPRVFFLMLLNLSNVIQSDGLVPRLPAHTARIRIEFLIKKCCVQGAQHLSFICLRELILRLFTEWRPSWLVTWITCFCFSNGFIAQNTCVQAVHPMYNTYDSSAWRDRLISRPRGLRKQWPKWPVYPDCDGATFRGNLVRCY